MDPWQMFESEVLEHVPGPLEVPINEMGDLAFPCFSLGKKRKKNPKKIALEIAESLKKSSFKLISSVEANGPYVNFKLDYEQFASLFFKELLEKEKEFGRWNIHKEKRAMVEFPSVNPNKPWHIGHARNAILGDTLANLLEAVGYEIVRTDYIDDLGLQVAKTLWGIENLKVGEGKFDLELGKLYAEAENKMDEKEVRAILKEMEKNGMQRDLCKRCVKAQYETGYKLGIFHNLMVWESDIVGSGLFEKALEKMKESEMIFLAEDGKQKGCLVVDLSHLEEFKGMKENLKVLIRSDGTATYVAKDIAFQMWKCGILNDPFNYGEFAVQPNGESVVSTFPEGQKRSEEPAEIVVNVIGMPQAHAQRMVYSVLKLLGHKKAFEKSYHLSYEKVAFEENGEVVQFSGRKGNWIDYTVDRLIEKAEKKARVEVEKKNPSLSEKEKKMISQSVGRGAVRYAMLKKAPERKIVFRWNEALSFDGDSAPYLQYAHARACRILEEKEANFENVDFRFEKAEKNLLRKLSAFPSLVKEIPEGMKHEVWGTSVAINALCEYGCSLAAEFNSFYNSCRVLGSEKEAQRLLLVKSFQQVMENLLTLLGIDAVKKM